MNMPSTDFRDTFTAREAYNALKAARHAGISVAGEYAEMADELYALGLKGYSKDAIEGVRTTVEGDSKIRTFLGKMVGGCSMVAVKRFLKAIDEHDRLKKFSAGLVQSDIERPLIPRTADKIFEHATIGELQADLRLVGIFTMPDDRVFLKDTLRTAPRLLVTSTAIGELMRRPNVPKCNILWSANRARPRTAAYNPAN